MDSCAIRYIILYTLSFQTYSEQNPSHHPTGRTPEMDRACSWVEPSGTFQYQSYGIERSVSGIFFISARQTLLKHRRAPWNAL